MRLPGGVENMHTQDAHAGQTETETATSAGANIRI